MFFWFGDPIGPNFEGFGAITPTNMVGFCWNFDQSYSSLISKRDVTLLEEFKFSRPQDVPKDFSFGPFLGPIYPRKTNYFAKKQIFSKNYNPSTIIWHKSQVPYKSENSYINFQKNPFFGPKMGPNCPLGPAQRVNTNSHIAYLRTIHP